MSEVRFFIPGIPSPGGSKSAFCLKKNGVYTGRAVVVDAGGKKTKLWRQEAARAALVAMKEADLAPWTCAIEVELIFHLPRPQSHFLGGNVTRLRPDAPRFPAVRPDCLKLARSTEDSLTGICYSDDALIVKETIEKAYGNPSGAWVIIREAGK